jgi:hypothetical protein
MSSPMVESFGAKIQRYLGQPVSSRLDRLAAAPGELEEAIRGLGDQALSRRPEAGRWSAKEILCHLRDIEELVIMRFHLMLAMDDPKVFVVALPPHDPELWGVDERIPYPADPDRWAEERQYSRNDATLALSAFRRRRQEVLVLLGRLTPGQWERASILPDDRRVTFAGWTAAMAAHDDEHVTQVRNALAV